MNKLILLCCCLASLLSQSQGVTGKWSGTMSSHLKFRGALGEYDRWIDITITNNVAQGTVRQSGVMSINGKEICREQCSGSGPAELHEVSIYKSSNTYRVHAVSPVWTCTQSGSLCEYPEPHEMHPQDISPTDQPLQNPNFLSGSQTTVHDITPTDKVTITMSWSLIQGPLDAVLIVTPSNYNNWMPKATEDERRKGTVMDIDMKLQSRNGGNSPFKVSRFELKLINTSSEKGTTLNMPLVPSPDQLPDLRFLAHQIGESIEADQSMEVNSEDGRTGTATIGCYDGGAWTTLIVEAVLDGGFRVKGKLLTPTGAEEIPIPKRKPDSKIATAWLTQYGNLADSADHEIIPGNGHKGDGLSAYEEYRGVFRQNEYKKLDPVKKELGIKMTQQDAQTFRSGISWFKNASKIEIIEFGPDEIGNDRKLNPNHQTSHRYQQYVLHMMNGQTENNAAGENRPADLSTMLPQQSELVVINLNWINTFYPLQETEARNDGITMPYTKEELLASTVAHEIAHGCDVNHHGDGSHVAQGRTAYEDSNPPFHIFKFRNGVLREIPVAEWPMDQGLNKRKYDIFGKTGVKQNQESGNLSCLMTYTSMYNWAFKQAADGSLHYYMVPLLPVGKIFCTNAAGTGLNREPNSNYFGNAATGRGNCLGQLRLKD